MNKTIIKNQPIINIGCLGCVSAGKSTLVKKLTGIATQRHSYEKVRNITIKQGYSNLKIWKSENKYITTDSSINDDFIINDDIKYTLVNHISFVDCPGHQDLILTMLSSLSLMDSIIIIISIEQSLIKQAHLSQHLLAARLSKKKIIICLNKIDLISKDVLLTRKKELDTLLIKYNIEPYIIIPCSFNKSIGLDYIINTIMNLYNSENIINKNLELKPLFRINRSFDINKPGIDYNDVKGGILGGTLIQGKLKVGDEIEIKPGYYDNNKWNTLKTTILSIKTDNNNVDNIMLSGLFGIGTDLDPYYCKNDLLNGNILGLEGYLPDTYININIIIEEDKLNIYNLWIPKINENIILQIGNQSRKALINNINNNIIACNLDKPVCINNNDFVIICSDKAKIIGEGYINNLN